MKRNKRDVYESHKHWNKRKKTQWGQICQVGSVRGERETVGFRRVKQQIGLNKKEERENFT